MYTIAKVAATLGLGLLAQSAGASTLLVMNAALNTPTYCIGGCDVTNLQVGDRFLLDDDAKQIDGNGDIFDVVVTLAAFGGQNAIDTAGTGGRSFAVASGGLTRGANMWAQYDIQFVQNGSVDINDVNSTGTVEVLDGATRINVRDIDGTGSATNPQDFTDVAGIDAGPLVETGAWLEEGGFDPSLGAPGGDFTYARMDSARAGDPTNWRDEFNDTATEVSEATWALTRPLTDFSFVWGVQAGPTFDTNAANSRFFRGYALSVTTDPVSGYDPTIAPVPLPAPAALLLLGIGALALVRRRARV